MHSSLTNTKLGVECWKGCRCTDFDGPIKWGLAGGSSSAAFDLTKEGTEKRHGAGLRCVRPVRDSKFKIAQAQLGTTIQNSKKGSEKI